MARPIDQGHFSGDHRPKSVLCILYPGEEIIIYGVRSTAYCNTILHGGSKVGTMAYATLGLTVSIGGR